MPLRAQLLINFEQAIRPVGLLDRFQVTGVIATWWGEAQNDLKTLSAQGFKGLIETWTASIVSALEDDKSKENPLDHALVKHLLLSYLADISELEQKKAELEALLKGAQPGETDEEAEESEDRLPEEDLKKTKKELGTLKKKLNALRDEFVKRLKEAVAKTDESDARELVLGILCEQLKTILGHYTAQQRQQVLAAFEAWWDKYRSTLTKIERDRNHATNRLSALLRELGYA